MKKTSFLIVLLLFFFISFVPFSPNTFLIFSQKNAGAQLPPYFEIGQDSDLGFETVIPSETTMVIRKGVTITMHGTMTVLGKLIIKGTLNEPVKIKNDGNGNFYSIKIVEGGEAEILNVDISGGGMDYDIVASKKSIFNTASARNLQGALYVQSGKLSVQNANFHDNLVAVSISGDESIVKINRSKFSNDSEYEVMNADDSENLDFRYNWWGNSSGPIENCEKYVYCQPILGDIDYSNFLDKPDFQDPVIIIPGIMGSMPWYDGGEWKLDPVFRTYDNLYASFKENGYEEEKNLFVFPYQWRDSNINNAKRLADKIQEIKESQNWPKVDIVAHSMGGLLAREYVESDYYQNDVDQLVMLGTPYLGAPKNYLVWEGGKIPPSNSSIFDLLSKFIFSQEAHEAGFDSIFDYVQNMPLESVRELLPIYDYIHNAGNENMRIYPNNYPTNPFLENLNNFENVIKLNSVEIGNITGKLQNFQSTISKIRTVESEKENLWEHGYPENFDSLFGDQGLEYGEGDGTVPTYPPDIDFMSFFADELVEIDSGHGDLPTKAQCNVIKELKGGDDCEYVSTFDRVKDLLTFGVFSPIDIQIIAPDGKKIGKNFTTGQIYDEIEGAYYTGYNTDNEFVTIPNPGDGEYKVLTQGTGIGEYKIEVAKISENEEGEVVELTGEILGTATEGLQEEKKIVIEENEISLEAIDTIPPVITAQIFPDPNENNWHNSDVTIHFDATDESGIKNITPDIILDQEGENQTVIGTAEDNFGNVSNITVDNINIDKTAPITEANVAGTKGEGDYYVSDITINFNAIDNLSDVEKTYYILDSEDLQEGKELKITGDGQHALKYYSRDLAGNIEEENELNFKIDRIAPNIIVTSPENTAYKNNQILKIKYEATDNLSGSDKIKTGVLLDGSLFSENEIDLSFLYLGGHNLKIKAIDEAGNIGPDAEVSFKNETDIDAIISNINHYDELDLISKKSAKLFLTIKLRNIKATLELIDFFNSRWMPAWAKNKVVSNLEENVNNQIENLIRQIENKGNFGEVIDEKVRGFLVESLEYIKI